MSEVWNTLIELQESIIETLNVAATEVQEPGMHRFNQPGWINRVWVNAHVRRAHVDVIDARETKGLWMMHVCIFPNTDNAGPIFGLDVIAGKNKVTGFFQDYSPTVDMDHNMIHMFRDEAAQFDWKKERELPDWAKAIFSKHMVAVGNINTQEELIKLCQLGYTNFQNYLEYIPKSAGTCDRVMGKTAQNLYAYHQKQNPHTPRTMTALGLNEDDVKTFVHECLFPDIIG